MNKFVLAIMASTSLGLISSSAFAIDHHMAGESAAPTQEDCAALHTEMMANVAEGTTVDHDAMMADLDDETRARADACHAMMHAAHHPDDAAEPHAGNHHDVMPDPAAAPAIEPVADDETHEADQPN